MSCQELKNFPSFVRVGIPVNYFGHVVDWIVSNECDPHPARQGPPVSVKGTHRESCPAVWCIARFSVLGLGVVELVPRGPVGQPL